MSSNRMERRGEKAHVIGVPLTAEGHVTPMMHLCSYLAQQGHSVTLALTHSDDFPAGSSSYDQIKSKGTWPPPGLNITVEKIKSSIGFSADKISNIVDFYTYTATFQNDLEELIKRITASHSGSCVLISDYSTASWCMDAAINLGVAGIILFPGSITWFWFELKMLEIVASGLVPMKSQDQELSEEENSVVFNNPYKFQRSEIPWHFWNSEPWKDYVTKNLSGPVLGKASRILVNSCCELEDEMLSCMVEELGEKLIPVGPLFLLSASASDAGLHKSDKHCLQWLDEQEPSSVVYIAFGSYASLSAKQREEFARGLEQSQKKFLWVVRTSAEDGHEEFLKDFCGRTGEQGLVVSWSPQTAVLSHSSVAAFVSHCGWNSTIESIACGKPVLCLPLLFDQGLNSRLIVERWKSGIKFSKNSEGVVARDEVERVIRAMMETNLGLEIRENVSHLATQLQESIAQRRKASDLIAMFN